MPQIRFGFPTREEATAFGQGVEYVNDASCQFQYIEESVTNPPAERFVVVVEDEDIREEDL